MKPNSLGVPLVERFDVDELVFSVGSDHDGVVFAPADQRDPVAQIPLTIPISHGSHLLRREKGALWRGREGEFE